MTVIPRIRSLAAVSAVTLLPLILPPLRTEVPAVFILFVLLTVVGFFYRRLFYAVIAVTALCTGVMIHLGLHWGIGDMRSRFEAVLESPLYESKEYLQAYLGFADLWIVLYAAAVGILIRRSGFGYHPRLPLGWRQHAAASLAVAAVVADITVGAPYPYTVIDEFLAAQTRMDHPRMRTISGGAPRRDGGLYDRVVIVIGESASRRHMSLYGYGRETTPFLTSLHPVRFDAIAPINQTRYAVPIELSPATVDNFDLFYRSASLPTLMKSLGYHTCWISNQGRTGIHDSSITSIANEADDAVFLNRSYIKANTDDKVVEVLARKLAAGNRREAYFIHLIGSHDNYPRRYPKEYAKFGDGRTVDRYDNTIYYTDRILSRIYARVSEGGKRLLIVYFSDHGEAVSEERSGHGFDPAYRDEYEPPLAIYSSVPNPRLDNLARRYGHTAVNLESLDDIVKIVIGAADEKTPVSTSRNVLVLRPGRPVIVDRLRPVGGS